MQNFEMETERLIIRRFRATDWEDLYGYLSDPQVNQAGQIPMSTAF